MGGMREVREVRERALDGPGSGILGAMLQGQDREDYLNGKCTLRNWREPSREDAVNYVTGPLILDYTKPAWDYECA